MLMYVCTGLVVYYVLSEQYVIFQLTGFLHWFALNVGSNLQSGNKTDSIKRPEVMYNNLTSGHSF